VNILFLLIPTALLLGLGFLAAFIWAVKTDQFEDLNTPAHRILIDEKKIERRSS
jgi:cbb3-type cytochrome oxidase maturation protein